MPITDNPFIKHFNGLAKTALSPMTPIPVARGFANAVNRVIDVGREVARDPITTQAVEFNDAPQSLVVDNTPRGFAGYTNDITTDFTHKYNTELDPKMEAQFQQWLKTLSPKKQSMRDYDLRGLFKAGMTGDYDENNPIQLFGVGDDIHFTDRFKKPNHPTFSTESIYNHRDGFVGGEWMNFGNNRWVYVPNDTNMLTKEQLTDYFGREEGRNSSLYDTRTNDGYRYHQGGGFADFITKLARGANMLFGNSTPEPRRYHSAGGIRG